MIRCSRFLLIAIVITLTTLSTSVYGAVPSAERNALITLYNSTNGDSWEDNSGWKTLPLHSDGFAMPGTEGSWFGITVLNDHVTKINLASNQLSRPIPPEPMAFVYMLTKKLFFKLVT